MNSVRARTAVLITAPSDHLELIWCTDPLGRMLGMIAWTIRCPGICHGRGKIIVLMIRRMWDAHIVTEVLISRDGGPKWQCVMRGLVILRNCRGLARVPRGRVSTMAVTFLVSIKGAITLARQRSHSRLRN